MSRRLVLCLLSLAVTTTPAHASDAAGDDPAARRLVLQLQLPRRASRAFDAAFDVALKNVGHYIQQRVNPSGAIASPSQQ